MVNRYNGDPRLVNSMNNPFLNMIDLMEHLEPELGPRQAAAAAVNDQGASGRVKLPSFGPTRQVSGLRERSSVSSFHRSSPIR
jgi:hypothetical protein